MAATSGVEPPVGRPVRTATRRAGRFAVLTRLRTDEELAAYRRRYAELSGYLVPPDYLHRAAVYGFHRRGRLVGGVVMATEPPLRTLDRVPEAALAALLPRVPADDVVELTCVWLDPELRSGWRSALFWGGLFLELGRQGTTYTLFGTEAPGLERLYRVGGPELVYEGPVVVDGVAEYGWIFLAVVATRWAALVRLTAYKGARALRRHRAPAPARPAQEESVLVGAAE